MILGSMTLPVAKVACVLAMQVAPPAAHDAIRVSGGVMAGLILPESKRFPRLPIEAVRQHVNGEVVMAVTIGTDGRIETVDVISGPQLLRETFVAAVRQWRYQPYTLDGVAQRVRTTVAITMQYGGGD